MVTDSVVAAPVDAELSLSRRWLGESEEGVEKGRHEEVQGFYVWNNG